MAAALGKRSVIADETVVMADDPTLKAMGEALGCPAPFVALMLGGA